MPKNSGQELIELFMREYFDKANCYDLRCEARDCCECPVFIGEFEEFKLNITEKPD